jgi:hypothetical protein
MLPNAIFPGKRSNDSRTQQRYPLGMYLQRTPPSPVEAGDILIRPKKSGFGFHYGTGLSNGLVKDTTPEQGKHVTTFEGFQDGFPAWIVRPDRTPVENLMVEQRALSTVGDPYHLGADNCEHDMTFAQTGVAISSTVNTVLGLGFLGLTIYAASQSTPKPKARRRRR